MQLEKEKSPNKACKKSFLLFLRAVARDQARATLETARHELAKAITQLSLTQERVVQGIGVA